VDYFDFYLFHTVSESNIDNYLDEEKYGLCSYLVEQKKKGRIRHLGFSVHAELETTKRFLEAYGEHMEFCQVQLNWIDWDYQDAKAKIELLKEYNIPVWVMEPLRGGKLAALPEECEARLRALRPEETIPAWSFRYLQSIPSVTVTLSGMSNREQLEENIRTFATEEPLSDAEIATLYEIAETMTRSVPCTACRYCVDGCPQSLDIPHLIKKYNEAIFHGKVSKSVLEMEEDALPTSCIGCAACEAACPQKIEIASVMADFADRIRKARA
jgi:predicted aldo/keto reductase-like oxidoreductase